MTQTPPNDVAGLVERLGEHLFAMSAQLKASGFLDSDPHHKTYEGVVAAFQALGKAALTKPTPPASAAKRASDKLNDFIGTSLDAPTASEDDCDLCFGIMSRACPRCNPLATVDTPPASVSGEVVVVPRDDDSRDFADSILPEAMIEAGVTTLEGVDEDHRNYIPGETTDWDYGMVAVAVYRAMLAAALKDADTHKAYEHVVVAWQALTDGIEVSDRLAALSSAPVEETHVLDDSGLVCSCHARFSTRWEAAEHAGLPHSGPLGALSHASPVDDGLVMVEREYLEFLAELYEKHTVKTDGPDRIKWDGEWHEGPLATAFIRLSEEVSNAAKIMLGEAASIRALAGEEGG